MSPDFLATATILAHHNVGCCTFEEIPSLLVNSMLRNGSGTLLGAYIAGFDINF